MRKEMDGSMRLEPLQFGILTRDSETILIPYPCKVTTRKQVSLCHEASLTTSEICQHPNLELSSGFWNCEK